MAKAKYETSSVRIPFAENDWNVEDNYRKIANYGEPSELRVLRRSLCQSGWAIEHPAAVMAITDERKAVVLAERQTRWDNLAQLAKAAGKDDSDEATRKLELFVALYTVNGTGKKLIEPLYSGLTGFRRASEFESAMLLQHRVLELPEEKRKGEYDLAIRRPGDYTVTATLYVGELTRSQILEIQLRENELNSLGSKAVTEEDNLRSAKAMFDAYTTEGLPIRQKDFRLRYKDTQGQKYWALVKLDQYFPQLRIVHRICDVDPNAKTDQPDSSWVNIKSLRQADLNGLRDRYETEEKERCGEVLSAKEKNLIENPLTIDEIRKVLNTAPTSKKRASDKDLKPIAESDPNKFLRRAMGSTLAGNVGAPLDKYRKHKDGFNSLVDVVDAGFGPHADIIGQAIVKDRDAMFLKACEIVGVDPSSVKREEMIASPVVSDDTPDDTTDE